MTGEAEQTAWPRRSASDVSRTWCEAPPFLEALGEGGAMGRGVASGKRIDR